MKGRYRATNAKYRATTAKYRRGIFVVAYCRNKEGGIEYLVLRRKHHWNGWEVPKGGLEPGEGKTEAARREVREETGLIPTSIKRFSYSGKYRYSRIFPDRPEIMGQTFSLYAAEVRKGKVKIDKREHRGYVWLNFEDAARRVTFSEQKKSLKMVNDWLTANESVKN